MDRTWPVDDMPMDLSSAASVASYQYQQTARTQGPAAAVAEALTTAQSLANQTTGLLPAGPDAVLELSPQAQALSALATQGRVDASQAQALAQQAEASASSGQAALLRSAAAPNENAAAALQSSYQALQSLQTGSGGAFTALVRGTAPGSLNTIA